MQHDSHDMLHEYNSSKITHQTTDKLMQINMNATGKHDTDQRETQHGIYYMKSGKS